MQMRRVITGPGSVSNLHILYLTGFIHDETFWLYFVIIVHYDIMISKGFGLNETLTRKVLHNHFK